MKALLKNLLLFFAVIAVVPSASAAASDSIHSLFDQLLTQHVDNGRVDYPAIKSDPRLNQYLDLIADYDTQSLSTRAEKLAFWINAYNALAIEGIIAGRSPRTLFGRYDYFISARYRVGQRDINLYDLEHDVIIPLGDPRIHFAIVCASLSCPALRSEAYVAKHLQRQLDDNASRFVNNPDKNSFDGKMPYVSKIFEWFKKDFSRHSGSLQKYLAQYVKNPTLAKKLDSETIDLGFLAYNWRLNGRPPNE